MEMHYLLHHVFTNSWQRVPDKHAVIDSQRQLSYSELNKLSGVLAQKLKESGIGRGDRVAFFLDHDCNQAISILAISSLGAVFIPVNRLLHPEQVRHIVFDSGSKVLITTRERLSQVAETMETCHDLKEILLVDDLDGENYLERTAPAIENDLAAILYTSGSSGKPKGVMLSHKNLLSGCWIVSEYLKLHGEDRLLGLLPLSFDYGLNQLLTMLALGGTYVFSSFKYPNDIVSDLARHKITGLAGIPPIWALLVRSSLSDTDLPDLRYITNSGGVVATSILDRLRKALPETDVFLMYGLTEAFRSTYLPPHQLDARPTSMGKAIPNTEIMVVSEDGKMCGPNEVGQLVHRGPTVSMGYWNRPEETEKRFRHFPWDGKDDHLKSERVVFSGDLVKLDDEGFLYFVGRGDGMIKCSGNRISPTEIEEVVYKTHLAAEVAAVGVSDSVAGQVIKIFVVAAGNDPSAFDETANEIMRFCSQNCPAYMVPRHVEFVDELPKTATGKIDYPELSTRVEL